MINLRLNTEEIKDENIVLPNISLRNVKFNISCGIKIGRR